MDVRSSARRSYLLGAGTIIVFVVVDWFWVGGHFDWNLVLVRFGWAATCAVSGFLAPSVSERSSRLLGVTTAAASGVACAMVVALTGGTVSPYLYTLPVLPLLIAHVEEQYEAPTWVCGALSLVGFLFAWVGTSDRIVGEGLSVVVGVVTATLWSVHGFRNARRLREAAIQSARLASVGRLAAGVAHEINNPLAYVISNVDWITEQAKRLPRPVGDPLLDVASDTTTGLTRIREIVEDLRGLARDSACSRDHLDVKDFVSESVRVASIRLRPRVAVAVNLPNQLPPVIADRGRLVQVLVNLLVNAADALQSTEQPRVRIWARIRKQAVEIVVDDNGPGLPPEVKRRLFQPFVSTKGASGGMGLGLSLASLHLAEQGGRLVHEELPSGGARFVLRLPSHGADAHAGQSGPGRSPTEPSRAA